MKLRVFVVLPVMLLLLSGCQAVVRHLDPAGNVPENRADAIQDAMAPGAIRAIPQAVAATTSREEAESIALEDAGFTPDQVTGLRTEYEVDDGIPRYEVRFRQGRWEYDYEINANNGQILSYDRDD